MARYFGGPRVHEKIMLSMTECVCVMWNAKFGLVFKIFNSHEVGSAFSCYGPLIPISLRQAADEFMFGDGYEVEKEKTKEANVAPTKLPVRRASDRAAVLKAQQEAVAADAAVEAAKQQPTPRTARAIPRKKAAAMKSKENKPLQPQLQRQHQA
eukprot:6191560-Pleurochrysis_carterae.AAC.1